MTTLDRLQVSHESLSVFCRRWKIARLSVFGSALRDDFTPSSDVDLLIALAPDSEWSLWDWIELRDEAAVLFGREIDLIEESGLKNPFRRHEILKTRQVLYAEPSH
jgi:predicted nucleotidyltransferase